ncbi:MAG: glycosyltransferase [Candidatus Omnitrophica bacterium]|nr:glycosyltransferase [Candidatus Omnitrophota bacterium]
MKVLIIHASAGAGHRRAAEAVYSYIKENEPALEPVLLDVLEKTNGLFKFFYTWGYSFLVHHAVWLWRLSFWVTDNRLLRPAVRSLARAVNRVNARDLCAYLVRENPDLVVSTHFLPSELVSGLKNKGKITSRLVTVITDFGAHSFWVSPGTDLYAVASEYTLKDLVSKGVSKDRVKVLGIPFDAKFLRKFDRAELCRKFGIDPKGFTVLLMTGSFGLGPLEEIAESLHRDCQVMVVCAGNKQLFRRLSGKGLENVKVFGFVDNAEELMAVSDLIVTKPGGATITETLVMGLPAVFISAIPGQESVNIAALAGYGVGASVKGIFQIKDFVLDLKNNPEKIIELKQRLAKIAKPFACKDLADAIR